MDKAKPFEISKYDVFEAYKRVKANRGAAGIDNQSIADFEQDWKNKLYKLWNRMSSGSYSPPPVRENHIKFGDGEFKMLRGLDLSHQRNHPDLSLLLEPAI